MEELLGRQAPHSAAAEQAVIGSMLIDTRCIPDVIERLRGAEFYIKQNRDIFETIYAMFSYGQTIDPVTVLDQMKVRGVYSEASPAYIAELMRITPTAANVLEYAAIVRDRALLRNLASAADEINNLVYEGSGEAENILEAAESKIYALRQGRNIGGLLPISTVVQTVYENISEAASSGRTIPGLSTGLKDLDKFILGLNKGELILIAARPAMGKTSIALNIAMDVAKNSDKTVAVFSLEMSREQLVSRLLAREASVPSQNMLTGQLSPDEWRRLASAAQMVSATDMRIDDNSMLTVADMNAQCRRLSNLGLVVIDYLQLMQSAGGKRYKPHAQDHGKGAQRSGHMPQPAQPSRRRQERQAPHAQRPARFRRYRAGCRRRHRPAPRGLLRSGELRPVSGRGHSSQKPQGPDGHRVSAMAARIYELRQPLGKNR